MVESDFHPIYAEYNPTYYDIVVCPGCLYAAFAADFDSLDEDGIASLARDSDERRVTVDVDFRSARNVIMADQSYRLALRCYELRGGKSTILGHLYHRLAWLARESHENEHEMDDLRQALVYFRQSIDQNTEQSAADELQIQYLLGELSFRVANFADSLRWLAAATTNKEIKKHPQLERQARERWSQARERRSDH